MIMVVDVHEAETQPSEMLEGVEAGEEIIRAGRTSNRSKRLTSALWVSSRCLIASLSRCLKKYWTCGRNAFCDRLGATQE